MRNKILFLLILTIPSVLTADRWSWLLLKDVLDIESHDGYKGQIINGWKKGYGINQLPDSSIYVGLFQENKITGTGIIIAPTTNFLLYADSAAYYVGKVKDGIPEGVGKLYDDSGKMLYKGTFVNGRPTEDLLSLENQDRHKFVCIDLSDGTYLFTESIDSILDGSAFMCGVDGSMWVGRFKNNIVNGLAVNITPEGEWQSFYVRKGEAIPQSASSEYEKIEEQRRDLFFEMVDSMRDQSDRAMALYGDSQLHGRLSRLQRFMTRFANACQIIGDISMAAANVVNTYQAIRNPQSDVGNGDGNGGGSLKSQYDHWAVVAKRHYNSLTNTGTRVKHKGDDIGGTNGGSLNGGNYVVQKQQLREAQNQMKSIRRRSKSKGINIPKSEYEDIVVKY